MPLDDFFAKREKKKTKKKQNPESLMRELVNDPKPLKSNDSGVNLDSSIVSSILKDDEWEILDDGEKEIDLDTIRISKLSVTGSEESSKCTGNDQGDDGPGSAEDTKKVWGLRSTEPPAEQPEPPVEEPKPTSRGVYVPVHLRAQGSKGQKSVKPNVGSDTDFPTLDAAAAVAPPSTTTATGADGKVRGPPTEDNEGWEQAGTARKPIRLSENPTPTTPATHSYVPPSLRQSMTPASTYNQPMRAPNYPEDRFNSSRPSNYESFTSSRTSTDVGTGGGRWARGSTISHSTQDSSIPSPKTMTPKAPTSSGWDRGSHTKTFRDMGQEKDEFQLAQSNRFAGLSGI